MTLVTLDRAVVVKSCTALGFDFGHARIGVAVGQGFTATARPLVTLNKRAQQIDWDSIDKLISEWQPDRLVVGVPYYADGSPNAVTSAALQFCHQLSSRYHLTVETIDEHLSSWEAEQRSIDKRPLKRLRHDRSRLDQMAAVVILETWFNQLKQRRSMPNAAGN